MSKLWRFIAGVGSVGTARLLLAATRTDGTKIYVSVQRLDRQGKGGGWSPSSYTIEGELVEVTEKRLKIRDFYGGKILVADPAKCSFVERC